jgi:hypothetical protein
MKLHLYHFVFSGCDKSVSQAQPLEQRFVSSFCHHLCHQRMSRFASACIALQRSALRCDEQGERIPTSPDLGKSDANVLEILGLAPDGALVERLNQKYWVLTRTISGGVRTCDPRTPRVALVALVALLSAASGKQLTRRVSDGGTGAR